MTIRMATITTINTTTRAPTVPRMPARRGEEGLLVGVMVVGSVKVLENTDVWMVSSAMVVVGITAVIDVGEAVGMMKRTLYTVMVTLYLLWLWWW